MILPYRITVFVDKTLNKGGHWTSCGADETWIREQRRR